MPKKLEENRVIKHVGVRERRIVMNKRYFRLWACCCAHVGTDLRASGRESLAEAIRQTENDSSGFEWDIAVHLGDLSGSQTPPEDEEGKEVVRQFSSLKKHAREHFYNIAGNHDASPNQRWFRRWVDPLGENTRFSLVDASKRPYPIEGTWERYSFRVGNVLFLMMSDRNDLEPPVGRLITREDEQHGGYPAGAVTSETFSWWRRKVEENPDAIIITAHHHMLKETTVASGPWEGFERDEGAGGARIIMATSRTELPREPPTCTSLTEKETRRPLNGT